MQIGMLGLGRMGANMTRRLLRSGHECVVYDVRAAAVAQLSSEGALGARQLPEFVTKLRPPRAVWLMLPAAITSATIAQLAPLLAPGDVIIDGGNSDYRDAIRHGQQLATHGIEFIDVGTSGGVWGLEEGYCLMVGGKTEVVERLQPIFAALAPADAAGKGHLRCGDAGAGHFVKMVHNGIEYALMAAYAEGFNLLAQANRDAADREVDAETAPVDAPEHYRFDFDVPAIAELWRHGSVVRSWLLDLAARALREDPRLARFQGRVSDSGEGRWTLRTAIDLGVPMPALAAALFARFDSQDSAVYANKLLSALREQFGGHAEKR